MALHLTRQASGGMNVPACYHPDALKTTIALMTIKHILRLWVWRRRAALAEHMKTKHVLRLWVWRRRAAHADGLSPWSAEVAI